MHHKPLSPKTKAKLSSAAQAQGLYRASHERDACGIGFVAHVKGHKSHEIIVQGLDVLVNLTHRAGCGADGKTGDGAGLLFQIPDEFFRSDLKARGVELPAPTEYGVGMFFLPVEETLRADCIAAIERSCRLEGLEVLHWREVPVDPSVCGAEAREAMPYIAQPFVRALTRESDAEFGRRLFIARKQMERAFLALGLPEGQIAYPCSFSHQTIVYKGLLMPVDISAFYRDLRNPRLKSAIVLVHSRFSTNTFPAWHRAHPYRYVVHNGEFNTIRGNVNWMRAREGRLASPEFGDAIDKIRPVIDPRGSDSSMFDNAVELLVHSGRSLAHTMMMLVPEAWHAHEDMTPEKKAFYQYHSMMMEPWDGPASIAFTDGSVVGALLDRNGLRPSRYVLTTDDLIVVGSEVGCLDIPEEKIVKKSRLEPGRMLLVDTRVGEIVDDATLKSNIASAKPYREWLDAGLIRINEIPLDAQAASTTKVNEGAELRRLQFVQGYTREDIRVVLRPMAQKGEENIGSMGNDTPLAVLSERPQLMFNYFKQAFAQVTNPPIDPLREALVMSLETTLGAEQNLLSEGPEHCRQIWLERPILINEELARIKSCGATGQKPCVLHTHFDVAGRGEALRDAIDDLCRRAEAAIDDGATILILSDRGHDERMAPIPALLAVAAVHHDLIRKSKRGRAGIVLESGEPREVMHFALLLGYGVAAINPYLVGDVLKQQIRDGLLTDVDFDQARYNYREAVCKGIKKIMSKMGISTLASYRGAQIFEAIGLSSDVIDRYLPGTTSKIEGIGLEELAAEVAARHHVAYDAPEELREELDAGGNYQWRRRGEFHMYNPETIGAMQHAVRSGNYDLFKKYSAKANSYSQKLCTIRGLLTLKPFGAPIPIDEVEPVASIVKRFRTGAMSFGSISKEAHENLAVAMNRIGGRSNTGEGGEESRRFVRDDNGDLRRSAIKQVASGRFGVTSNYLVNADEIQIKMAQGAKPGEGGQLPGHKVDEEIARVRHSTPGVGLISPPPHHDIYSIEDLAQLIYDLKNANDRAGISVKLVSESGVGTIAAGVAKAKADAILIAGDSGGTGASPLTSIKYAGTPWELGLAETQQTLLINDLRSRVRLEADGQLKTGRDVAVAALLGAEEFGFGTAALVASGCIMMRVCHLNTCPVGVATQDPELRRRFRGQPEHVINFMYFVAQELREIMAELGFRNVLEMVGRVECLEFDRAIDHYKATGLDLSPLLYRPELPEGTPLHSTKSQDHGLERVLDRQLVLAATKALHAQIPVRVESPIKNTDRSVGTILSAEISRTFGEAGLAAKTIELVLHGAAGQSFGAFLAHGVHMKLFGDANDYVGKGLSGGDIIVVPPKESRLVPEENIIIGNVALYGATRGRLFVRGRAGERFAVRNSGSIAVVEGVGDHGCEYMTGGTVVVLGRSGRNFAAGMSGGVAYVWDELGDFERRCNRKMVELTALDTSDEDKLHALIQAHVEATDSGPGNRILRDWERYRAQFIRVMSPEYRKVMQERSDAQAKRTRTSLPTISS